MLEELLVDNVVLNPSSVLIRRSALEAAGGFSEIPFGEDWDTWIEIAKRFPIGFIDRPLALVRRHSSSVSPSAMRVDVNRAIVEPHLQGYRPAWKRPLIRRRGSLRGALPRRPEQRQERRPAAWRGATRSRSIALDPFTLGRRKAKLLTRASLSGVAGGRCCARGCGQEHAVRGRRA